MSLAKRAGDTINVTFDWSDALPTGVTVISATHTMPNGLTLVTESNTATTSTARISGGSHGRSYQLKGTAVLDSGETVVDYVTIIVVNSA